MADTRPIKVIRDASGDTTAFGEFTPADLVPVNNGGTGADNPSDALANIDAVPNAAHNAHLLDAGNPHNVTAAQTGALSTALKGDPQGLAELVNGKVPITQLPARVIPSIHVVANESARLALTVQEGDEAKQLDNNEHFIYDGTAWHGYHDEQPIFGQGFKHVNENEFTHTFSNSFESKMFLLSTTKANARYRFGWSYQWSSDSTSNDFEARILVNGVEFLRHIQEPQDSSGTSYNTSGTNQRYTETGFNYYNQGSAAGNLNIEMQYRTSNTSFRVSIWNARIEVWRVL